MFAPILSGCGGGGGVGALTPSTGGASNISANSEVNGTTQLSNVEFSIAVPNEQALIAQSNGSRTLKYISAATKSASISVTSNGQAAKNMNVGCGETCAATMQVPVGVNTFKVSLYDGTNASGHVLATGGATTTIAQGQQNNVAIVFNGVPAKLAVAVTPATFTVGTAATATVAVTAYDAGNHIIVGAQNYANPITLKHSDTSGVVALSTANLLSPSTAATARFNGARGVGNDVFTASVGAISASANVVVNVPATPAPVPATPKPIVQLPSAGLDVQLGGVPQTIARKHILTYQEQLGSTQTRPFGSNYGAIAPYVDYAASDANATPALRAAGVKVGFYATTHTVCITQVYGQCTPDAAHTPDELIAKTCDGHRVTFSSPPSPSNPNPLVQFQTDPSSPAMITLFNKVIDDKVNNNGYGAVQYDFIFDDNAYVPGDSVAWQRWYDYDTGAPSSNSSPYCGYNSAKWISGMRNMFANSKLPVIANAFAIPDNAPAASSALQYLGAPNLWGGMFEFLYGSSVNGPERYKESGRLWQSEENTQLGASNAHRLMVGYEHVGGTDGAGLDQRLYVYASIMLGYDPDSFVLADNGAIPASHVGVNPEAQLVPTRPLVPQPRTIDALHASSGAYVREYAACYYKGNLIGACASIVNSNANSSVPLPALSRSYGHTAVISGSGIVPNVDDGRVRFDGNPAPATIGAKTALIVTE